MEIAIFIFFVLIIAGIALFVGRQRLISKQARFADRESLSIEMLYSRFYESSGLDKEEVLKNWLLVANTLKLDPTKLRPSDQFKKEYAPVKGYLAEDELVELEEMISKKCKSLKIEIDKVNIQTLDDFIRFMMKT